MKLSEFKKLVKASFEDPECPYDRLAFVYEHWARFAGFKDWNTMRACFAWEPESDGSV